MDSVRLLKDGWEDVLLTQLKRAQQEIVISSPFVTQYGIDALVNGALQRGGKVPQVQFVTNLSPLNQVQGITDPQALQKLPTGFEQAAIFHLPRLHAKTYVFDAQSAIVTSGNLTAGGLRHNHEYGILIDDAEVASAIRRDILDYADLGTPILAEQLARYCDAVEEASNAYREHLKSASKSARQHFEGALQTASDELIALRLQNGPIHTVFERTAFYLLRQHRELGTAELHQLIQDIHPELCDDSIDRVINGQHFGKRWKHAVRTAQQQLKKKGLVRLEDGKWRYTAPYP